MIEYFKMAFEKYADFQSRSTRSEYWWFFLCNLVLMMLLNILGAIMAGILEAPGVMIAVSVIVILYALAVFIPNLAVSVRRLHDTNRSGWFILLGFIPLIGGILLLVFYAQESDPQPNKWGAVPGSSSRIEDALVDFDKDLV